MRIAVIMAALVLSVLGRADHRPIPDPGKAEVLRLVPLIEEALGNNAELRAAKAETEVRDAAISPASSFEDPMLGIEAMNYPVDTFRPHDNGMTGVQVSVAQRFPFPGKLGKKGEAARHEAEAQKALARSREIETVRGVKLAYYELFLAYRKLDTAKEQRAIFDQVASVARSNYSLGRAPQAEVLNLQVESASLLDQSLGFERQIKTKLGELNHLLGRADHERYLYGRPDELKPTPFDFHEHTERALLERALAKSPLLVERKAKVNAAEAKLSFARRNYLPDFEVRLGYTFRQQTRMDNGVDFVSGMLGITIPLWAGGKQSEEKRGAAAEKVRSEALLDEERNMLAHRLHVVYAELEEASQRLKLFERGVLPLTRQATVAARSAYLTGKLDYATLLGTMNKRFQMELANAEALTMFHARLADLEAILGGSLEATP